MRGPRSSGAPRRAAARLAIAWMAGCAAALASAAAAQPIAVHGRVEDDAKRPIAGATARLLPLLGLHDAGELHLAGTYPPPPAAEAKSGADGTFRLEAPRAGLWRLVVDAPERAEREVTLAPLVEETWLRPAVLPRESSLEVLVVGPGGAPVADARIAAARGAQGNWSPASWQAPIALLRTGPDGRAVVPRAASDRIDLSIAAPGLAPAERKEVATSPVRVELVQGPRRAVLTEGPGGEPVAGVLVVDAETGLPLGRTGPGGRLLLTLGAGAPRSLHFEDAKGATARVTVEPQPRGSEPAPVAVRLAPPIPVAGRVIDSERRRAVPGAVVWFGGRDEVTTTDAQGGYRLTRSAASRGRIRANAAAAGYFGADVELLESAATAPTLALDPVGSLAGSVTDAQGRALAGVEITSSLVPDRASMMRRRPRFGVAMPRATSDERGRFRLAGMDPRSRYRVTFRRTGHAPLRRDVTLPPGRPGQLDVVLDAGVRAHGVVVDARGEPVSGAELELRRQEQPGDGMMFSYGGEEGEGPDADAASDPAGRFAFTDLASGRYVLSASAPGHAAATLPGIEVSEGASALDLGKVELGAAVSITGRVVDGRGQPVAGADVFALTGEDAEMPMLRWVLPGREPTTATGADGAFAIADRGAGERVTVAARRGGYTSASAVGVVAPNEEPVVITLREASDLRGRVVDARGEPVAGARVALSVERSGGGMTFRGTAGMSATREDGRFELEDVEPGVVRLTVSAEGYLELVRGGVEVPPGRDLEGIELVLQPGAVVEGVVTTPDGTPAIGARVGVASEGDGGMMRSFFMGVTSDGDGRYRLGGVEPGRRTVTAQLDGFERGVGELEVVPGENRLDLRLGAGQQVSGRVTGPRGEPVAGAAVRLALPGERWWSRHGATADDAGAFSIDGVPDGIYEASASHPDHAEGRVEVNVAGAPVADLVIELASGGVITGMLRGLEPAELARATVSAGSDDVWRSGVVERDGRYRVSGISLGRWRVFAQVESSGRQARGSVEVAAGQPEATLDLDFTGGLSLHGVVRHEGRPVDGAMVMTRGQDVAGGGRTETDYQGRYRLENLAAGTYHVEVFEMVRGLRARRTVTVEEDQELDVDLRAVRISGRVLEATSDEPVSGALLELEPLDDEQSGFRFAGRDESDDRGAFVMGSAGEGRWRLRARKEGYAPAELTLELAGEPVEGLELRLQPTQGITLGVTRTVGSPPEQVYVAVIDGAGRLVTGGLHATGEGGAVRVSTVPAGSWEVLVRADGTGTARVAALSPGPPVAVHLAPQATLEVLVPELEGDEGLATVALRGADGRPFLFFAWLSDVRAEQQMARGRTILRGLPAGAWTVEVTARDGRRWSAPATTAAGAAATVELH